MGAIRGAEKERRQKNTFFKNMAEKFQTEENYKIKVSEPQRYQPQET